MEQYKIELSAKNRSQVVVSCNPFKQTLNKVGYDL